MTDKRADLLIQTARAFIQAAGAGAFGGRSIQILRAETVAGPRAGAVALYAGLETGRLYRALAADDAVESLGEFGHFARRVGGRDDEDAQFALGVGLGPGVGVFVGGRVGRIVCVGLAVGVRVGGVIVPVGVFVGVLVLVGVAVGGLVLVGVGVGGFGPSARTIKRWMYSLPSLLQLIRKSIPPGNPLSK